MTGKTRKTRAKTVAGADEAGRTRAEIDRSWHLARTGLEIKLAEMEYALMRSFEAFGRWQTECLASVVDLMASGPENALLHVIRMHDRPKNMKTLARLTNREDIPNLQYALRKLVKAGLVARTGSGRAGVTYTVTPMGREVTDRYAEVRREWLVSFIEAIPDAGDKLDSAAKVLDLLSGIYEQAGRIVATHRQSA